MSEFDTLKNMLEREGGKYEVDIEEEYNDDTGKYEEVNYLCVPAVDEYLILGFDKEGKLCYIDAEFDWEDYLKRKRGE